MTTLEITPRQHATLRQHLFLGSDEQVVFAFADWVLGWVGGLFRVSGLELIPAAGFAFQSDYHVELDGETQARIIKMAFDRQASLVEFHSHRSRRPAQFSGSDFSGFAEFVPHVRWRLGARPYAAAVFHETSFDGLSWQGETPVQLDSIRVGGGPSVAATGLTLKCMSNGDDE